MAADTFYIYPAYTNLLFTLDHTNCSQQHEYRLFDGGFDFELKLFLCFRRGGCVRISERSGKNVRIIVDEELRGFCFIRRLQENVE